LFQYCTSGTRVWLVEEETKLEVKPNETLKALFMKLDMRVCDLEFCDQRRLLLLASWVGR